MKKEERKEKKNWWNSNTKKQKIGLIIAGIFSIAIICLGALFLSIREFGMIEAADAIFGEGISGWAWFAGVLAGSGLRWAFTIAVIAVAFLVSFIVHLLIGVFTWKGKRSKTIGSLIRSLIRYVIVIIAAGMILSIWGVDVASIVAGLGVVTLIIGLGCQSLISDIVSGLFVVFDDFYDVGDIVVIDSFRGTITEIGLRSTKLVDWAGNIKSINNSQITTVTNLSRLATTVFVTFTIDKDENLEKVESIIFDNLSSIEKMLPKVIGKIEYRGVNSLEQNGITLAFLANCEEDNRYQVNRDINRELYLLMRKNGIKVPFSKMFVTHENERETPEASEEEKEKANAINQANRKIN